MKKILYIIPLLLGMTLASCEYDDSGIWNKLDEYGKSIKDHEERISALEELCKKMNTNISSLQTIVAALENNDYVTNVSPVREDGVIVGYTISFSKSDTITIYHGQDGADGQDGIDGKDGYTPQIGVMKDLDGIYYWTLDGEWLLDGKGNKIKAVGVDGENGTNGENGSNGANGEDGKDGTNGIDGITPRLKIENDYWYISYDNGATWELLGKATGEDGKDGADGENGADGEDGKDGENGADGEDGKDGDNIFSSVTQDDEYVYFNMSDGTMITLPKHDKENIQFEDLRVKAICCKNWDTNNDGELSYAEAAAVETIGTKFKGNTDIIAFTELKYFTGITEIPADAFNGCTALWKVAIPENVISIDDRAFYGCKGFIAINLPNSITTIGTASFYGCTSLKHIILPSGIQNIYGSAFYGCTSLLEITIPDNVVILNASTFEKCTSLSKVIIGNGVSTIEKSVFGECSSLGNVYCMPTTPPAVAYVSRSYYGDWDSRCAFPENVNMKIYVPYNSYEAYTQYTSGKPSYTEQTNWAYFKSHIEPYDFEE